MDHPSDLIILRPVDVSIVIRAFGRLVLDSIRLKLVLIEQIVRLLVRFRKTRYRLLEDISSERIDLCFP